MHGTRCCPAGVAAKAAAAPPTSSTPATSVTRALVCKSANNFIEIVSFLLQLERAVLRTGSRASGQNCSRFPVLTGQVAHWSLLVTAFTLFGNVGGIFSRAQVFLVASPRSPVTSAGQCATYWL